MTKGERDQFCKKDRQNGLIVPRHTAVGDMDSNPITSSQQEHEDHNARNG